jgi:hypothetical protein
VPTTAKESFTFAIIFLRASKYKFGFEDKFLAKYTSVLKRHQYASCTSSTKQGNKTTLLCATLQQKYKGPTETK